MKTKKKKQTLEQIKHKEQEWMPWIIAIIIAGSWLERQRKPIDTTEWTIQSYLMLIIYIGTATIAYYIINPMIEKYYNKEIKQLK